ncbi:MAG: hypothetical protein ACLFTI_10875, partial [Anaerolineales bacterium]
RGQGGARMRARRVGLLLCALAMFVAGAALAQTSVPPDIVVETAHIFIAPQTDAAEGTRLLIAEEYVISNHGTETYTGTLSFTLPDEARALTFDGPGLGERYRGDPHHFTDTQPIPPGSATSRVGYSYEFPASAAPLIRALDAPVASVVLILHGERLALTGEQLSAMERVETEMGPARAYVAGPLAAGEPLLVDMIPAATTPHPPGRNTTGEIGLGMMALAVGLGVAYRLWRAPSAPPLPEALRPQVRAIAALDAEFAAGALPPDEYEQRRARLKQALRAALRDEKFPRP